MSQRLVGRAAVGLVAVAAAIAAGGCAAPVPKPVDFSEARRTFVADDYPQVLAAWTRHAKSVRDVGTVIELWGTFKSWEFRQAYIERYASIYGVSEAERGKLYESQREASRKTFEIHVAMQTTNFKWNDLGKDTSAWRVSLVDGTGAEISPIRIEALKLPELYETEFFPYRTEFTTSYLLKFNRTDAEAGGFSGPHSGRVTLRVVSPLAKAELVWESQ